MQNQNGASRAPRVALVSMPWATISYPSLALGIIKAKLAEEGVASDVLNPLLGFAQETGFASYERTAAGEIWPFLGEWLFSKAAFPEAYPGDSADDVPRWLHLVQNHTRLTELFGEDYGARLGELRDRLIPEFCAELAQRIQHYSVFGFTCTFNQLLPALAASRAIKRLRPEARILFGGPQLEGEAGKEIVRSCPWVDAVYNGEFEVAGLETIRWALGELDEPPREFVSYRDSGGNVHECTGLARLLDMDESPAPDYDEFFAEARGLQDRAGSPLILGALPFESARGCWWGERHHCTFCGLNGQTMPFRSKDPDRVLDEVLGLAERYEQVALQAVDNIIDHGYRHTLLPRLKEMDLGLEFFYETKANLKRADVKLFREAGIALIQPGIESFSSRVLGLMNKGVSAIQNVYLLKLCLEYGIRPEYNVLAGFPDERPEDNLAQVEWIARITHMFVPNECCSFTLQRHSPMQRDPGRFQLTNIRPRDGYDFVFPPESVDQDRVAFYFDFDQERPPGLDESIRDLRKAVRRWKKRWVRGDYPPELTYRKGGAFVMVHDDRLIHRRERHVLTGLDMEVFLAVDDPVTVLSLAKRFGGLQAVEAVLASLERLQIIIREGDKVLGLAVPHLKRARTYFYPKSPPTRMNPKPRGQRVDHKVKAGVGADLSPA